MDTLLNQNKTFENIDFSEKSLSEREFIKCEFINCNFSKSSLGHNDFIDCLFKNCNLSMATLQNTGLNNIKFIDCKLMGLDFSVSNSFSFSINFQGCILDYSTFLRRKLKKTNF